MQHKERWPTRRSDEPAHFEVNPCAGSEAKRRKADPAPSHSLRQNYRISSYGDMIVLH